MRPLYGDRCPEPQHATISDFIDQVEELEAQLAACAAGPWRYDVENAPKVEWLSVWYAEHPRDWFKARLGIEGHWETEHYTKTRTPTAFAVPNPPQVTP